MSKNYWSDDNKTIEEKVKRALNDVDLSNLKSLAPVAQKALGSFIFGSRTQNNVPPGAPQDTTQTGEEPSVQYPPPSSYPPPQTRPVQTSPPFSLSNKPQRINPRISRGLPQIILGSIGAFIFVPITLLFLVFLFTVTDLTTLATGIVLTIGCAAIAIVSIYFLVRGMGKYGLAGRVIQLSNLLQSKRVYTLEDLASATGRSPKQIKRDLRKIRSQNMIPELHTDADEKCVMWGQDTYEQYLLSEEARLQKIRDEESRRQRLENPATADIEFFRSEGEAIIQKIRAANEVIPGEEISAKLDTLEDTVTRIFIYVERYPEKLPSTRKFMNHYLPTTLKLVEKYHQYDRMDFEPQNVQQAKAEIERSMDTINVAFGNLLESLFVHDTLDVSTDIKVLENMLEQEGLIGNTFKIDQPGSTQ